MDATDLDRFDWIPAKDRQELKRRMEEYTGPGKGFVLIAVPPSPEREGFVVLQPCFDPRGTTP